MNLRQLLLIGCVTFILSACSNASSSNEKIKVVSWSGKFQEDLMNDWVIPAAKSADVNINEGTWNGDYASLTSKIDNNINAWDLVHVEDYYINISDREKFFEKIPADITQKLGDGYKNEYAVPILEYGYILTLQKDLMPAASKSDSVTWRSLWDLSKYPGKRGLRDFPLGNIEIALLANGRDLTKYLYDPSISSD